MLTLLIYPALRLSKRLAGSAAKTQALSTNVSAAQDVLEACRETWRRASPWRCQAEAEASWGNGLPLSLSRICPGQQHLPAWHVSDAVLFPQHPAQGECACGSLQSDTRAGHALQPYIPLSVQVCRAGPAIQQPAPCCAAAPCALCGGPGVPAQSNLWAAPGSICGRWVHLAKVRVSCLSSGPTGVSARSDGGLQAVVRAPPLGPTLFSSKPGMHFKTCA